MYDEHKEELYTIQDPTGVSQHRGVGFEYRMDLAPLGQPLIRWRDRLIEADVYEYGDYLCVHLFCPKCTTEKEPHTLLIDSRKKRVRYSRGENKISIEKIGCTYPGCDWRAVIEDNVAKDG